jgi:alpha-beta hydrolase superfamily lysophospholipase
MTPRAFLPVLAALLAAALTACAPTLQHAGKPDLTFRGPSLEGTRFVSFDGARLGVSRWDAAGEPWAVIVGVHGMNDYANAFHLAGPYWAGQGITTIAYDQRGFGRSPQRGIWAGDALMTQDLRTITALVRAQYPHAIIAVAGESLGGSVVIEAMASDDPPPADRAVLLAPAVWGWSNLPLPYKTALWLADHTAPAKVFEPPGFVTAHISPSDNHEELVAMGRDPLMVWGARSDTLYGLVSTMQHAWKQSGDVKVPVLWLYGDHDQVIPKGATYQSARRLKPTDRSAFYAKGWHLLLVDHQAPTVWRDVAAFLRDPKAPLPSGAPIIPGAPTPPNGPPADAPVEAALPSGSLVAGRPPS